MTRTGSIQLWVLALAFAFAFAPAVASADPGIDELTARLAALDAELAAETQRGTEAAAAARRDIAAAGQTSHDLASALLDVTMERTRLADRRASLERDIAKLDAGVKQLNGAVWKVCRAATTCAEPVSIRLAALPGQSAASDQLRDLAARWSVAEDTSLQLSADAFVNLVSVLDSLHHDATRVQRVPCEMRTASGRLEAVELLQVGHAAFAYRVTADPSRVAVARPAPDNAGGFRWRETTGAAIGEPLRAAFDALVRRDASITVPLDVSGRAQPDSDLANGDGWLGFWSAGGPVMVPLGLVALLALVLIVERCVALFVLNRGSDLLARRVLDDCRAGRFDEALRAADSRRNVSARVLASALRRRGSGSQAVEDSIQEALLHEVPRVGRFLGGLAVLAAIAPLLGLLGTVTGIIETFHVIRQFGNADPGLMAGGISQALITTATGLSIAIPILVVHSLLRARGDRVLSQAETSAAAVLNLLNWDAPSSPSSTPTPPPTPTPEAAP